MSRIGETSIFSSIALIIISILNLCLILYSWTTKTIHVTCGQFIEDEYIIFCLLVAFARQKQ